MKPNAINYLSLARKAGRIEVGEEPAGAAARAGHARLLLVASDAPENTVRRAQNFVAGTEQQMIVVPFTKEEMGAALGRSVVSLAAMIDPSMALAFVKSLEEPVKYASVLDKLSVKAERQRKRQQEEKAHQKNLRKGKNDIHHSEHPQKSREEQPEKTHHAGPEKKSGDRKFYEKDRFAGRAGKKYGGQKFYEKDHSAGGKNFGSRESFGGRPDQKSGDRRPWGANSYQNGRNSSGKKAFTGKSGKKPYEARTGGEGGFKGKRGPDGADKAYSRGRAPSLMGKSPAAAALIGAAPDLAERHMEVRMYD